jgi:hypothetical protein
MAHYLLTAAKVAVVLVALAACVYAVSAAFVEAFTPTIGVPR